MLSLFPCDWDAIGKKPDKSLADGNFLQKIAKIQGPAPAPVKGPAKIEIPDREMLRPGEEQMDTTEIDRLWADLNDDFDGTKVSQLMRAISAVRKETDRTIQALENPSAFDDGAVSRQDLLKLLRSFSKYSRALENYLREKTPSSHYL